MDVIGRAAMVIQLFMSVKPATSQPGAVAVPHCPPLYMLFV